MKQFVFLLAFFSSCFSAYSQTNSTLVCQYGFRFEISMQRSWGYRQPVVLSVTPNTPAAAAGLSVNDIIEKINDIPTNNFDYETVFGLLQEPEVRVQLTVSNLKERNKVLALDKFCYLNNSLSERELANIYSFYSLEDVQARAFTCPFRTTVNPENNLIQYATFGFAAPDPNNVQLDNTINAVVQKSLEQKGLSYSDANPDLIVYIHYSLEANPNFRNDPQIERLPLVSRYNVNTKTMESLPVFFHPLIHPDHARSFLKFGIRLIDNKNRTNATVWECEASELLQSGYPLADYAEFHVPLMLMQYPYPKTTDAAHFHYSRSRYNFTGISYNMNNLREVTEVIPSSPAANAGIQAGDIIERINGIRFANNTRTADNNYRQFIFRTSHLRDPATQFTNSEGFTRCMYWDVMNYVQISEEFKKPQFSTTFAYLFYFRPYINLSGTNIINFSIARGRQREEVRVTPVIISEESFELVTGHE